MTSNCEPIHSVCSLSGESWSALLDVNQEHSFFFDHPVDHVPGMMLMSSVVALAERAGAECGKNGSNELVAQVVELRFLRICELDKALRAHASMTDANGLCWDVEVTQGGRRACAGSVRLATLRSLPPRPWRKQRSFVTPPASAALTHRCRPENVAVSSMERIGHRLRVGYLGLPRSRRRSPWARNTHAIEELGEAARQFATLMCHSVAGVDMNTGLLLNSIFVDISRPLPRQVPITLLSAGPEIKQRRMTNTFAIDSDGKSVGSARITSSILRMVSR